MSSNSSEDILICSKYSSESIIKKAISRVIDCLGNYYNVEVYLDKEYGNYFIPNPFDEIEELEYSFGFIEIDETQDTITQLFSLLHEAGHVREYYERYENIQNPNYIPLPNNISREIVAWEYGFVMANRLGIKFDIDEWSLYKNICLEAYKEEK